MTEKSPHGLRDGLFDMLADLSGHLEIASSRDEQAVNALHEELAHALWHDDLASVKNRYFSVDSSDLFFGEALPPERRTRLAQLADQVANENKVPELRVFVRDTPIRTTQRPLHSGASQSRYLV